MPQKNPHLFLSSRWEKQRERERENILKKKKEIVCASKKKKKPSTPFSAHASDADPEFYFAKKFKDPTSGYTNRSVRLVCHLNQPGAKIRWYRDGKAISVRIQGGAHTHTKKRNFFVCVKICKDHTEFGKSRGKKRHSQKKKKAKKKYVETPHVVLKHPVSIQITPSKISTAICTSSSRYNCNCY